MFLRSCSKHLLKPTTKRLFSSTSTLKSLQTSSNTKNWKTFGKYTWRTTWISTLLATSYIAYQIYDESTPVKQIPQSSTFKTGAPKKTVVILGSGWGAVSLLKNLDTTLYNVVVVSPRNYFLFTPLLPSAPTGTVDLRSIIEPIRSIVRRLRGEVKYFEAEATDVDPKLKTVNIKGVTGNSHTLNYDYLVVAVGAKPNTFGIPGVYENASFLKEITDAQQVRSKILHNIEKAQTLPKGSDERKRLLSFVIVGGGPTGVEFAAELQDFVHQDLNKWYHGITDEIQVTLVEALPKILNMFEHKLIKYTQDTFKEANISLRLNTAVKNVDSTVITASIKNGDGSFQTEKIPYGVLVWATGNGARDITTKLASKLEGQTFANRGLLFDEGTLKVIGDDSIFALGDCTLSRKLAPTAQVANQEGIYLSKYLANLAEIDAFRYKLEKTTDAKECTKILSKINDLSKFGAFHYNHLGAFAYIGSEKAVVDLTWNQWPKMSLGGSLTFLLWKSAYVGMCLSFRNKCLVVLDWMKLGLFGRDSSKEA